MSGIHVHVCNLYFNHCNREKIKIMYCIYVLHLFYDDHSARKGSLVNFSKFRQNLCVYISTVLFNIRH